MKQFRFILTLLALLMISSAVLVSCNGDAETTTDAPATDPEVTTEAPEETTEATDETTSPSDETTEETTVAPETTEEVVTEPPHTHSFGAPSTVKAATCTEEGLTEKVCSCGEKETEIIPKTEHKAGEWVIDKEATATEEGSKHQACTVCGTTVKTEPIPVTPHTPGEWIIDKEATCTEDGSKHRVCTKCGDTADAEIIPAKGHTEVVDAAVNATCTADGKTEGKHCSACDTVITAQTKIPAKGHTEKIVPAKAATCTESGLTEGKTCIVCYAQLVPQQTIAALGHKLGEWIVDKEATLTEAGSKHQACTVCGKTINTEAIPKIEPVKLDYTVTVVDGFGAPAAGIKVSFVSSESVVAEITTNASGEAVANLPEGEYQAVVDVAEGFYAPSSVELSPAASSVEVTIVPYIQDPEFVYPDEVNGVYSVSVGSVRVPVKNDEMRYFLFAPTEGAYYRVYTDTDKVEVGYYGGSFYISETNAGTMLDGGVMELKILHSAVGNVLVIGLKSTSSAVAECTLTIVRYSDIDVQISELAYEQYQLAGTPQKTETPAGNMNHVPITVILPTGGAVSEISVFYNKKDGYYHLNSENGPILYVQINTASLYQAAFATIVEAGANIGRHIYDDQGNFVKKEAYNEAILLYSEAADATHGVVPLDHDLVYILKSLEGCGWYDRTSPNCIFTDNEVIVMPYNGWLFACVYFE